MLLLPLTVLAAVDFINGDFFRDIYDEYKDKVYKGAFKMLRNHHDAEEVVQDVFLKIYKTIETFRNLPREEFAPLIVIYMRNTALDYLRKKKREVPIADITYDNDGAEKEHDIKDYSPEPAEIVIDRERAAQIGIYIDSLPEKQRQVMILRYKYDMSEKDIAKAMSMTETAVSSCVNRAKNKLRERMSEEKYE